MSTTTGIWVDRRAARDQAAADLTRADADAAIAHQRAADMEADRQNRVQLAQEQREARRETRKTQRRAERKADRVAAWKRRRARAGDDDPVK